MRAYDLLTEMPQLVPAVHSAEIEQGIDDCLKHVNSATAVESFDEDAALYELNLKDVGYYFVYDRSRPLKDRVEYFVRYKAVDLDPSLAPAKAIRQVLFWRNKAVVSAYSANIAKKVFWEHLFPKYRCLASDATQTSDGQRYWSAAVSDALSKGLTVRIINTNDKTHVDVKTKKAFNAQVSTTWGTGKWFQRMVIVIYG